MRIDKNKCLACGMCIDVCPVDAIKIRRTGSGYGVCYIDSQKCIDCGECKIVCSGDAIGVFDL